ncbi:hypothetical protein [Mesoterricola sediminis]|uniref:Uncharacterized protein n=1 Tax=Mesoterricola sediminis TaxID=2927980 RepID=A0AA48GTU8_9BACT|nr:hypothetical protein [Mesoterricola sediminis]BDU77502.1 hypothetical protein METESE_24600 [Mesoterricola sediminis]
MRFFQLILAAAFLSLPVTAAGSVPTTLDYRVKVRLRDAAAPLEGTLKVATLPPIQTRNRVKKPRFVAWRVTLQPEGRFPAPVAARLARLLYLEGPGPGLVPREGGIRVGSRFCRFWQAQTPASVGAFVYLAEIGPDLLALSYLSASLPDGEIASVELHLDRAACAPGALPAEEGRALLTSLKQWGALLEESPMQEERIN